MNDEDIEILEEHLRFIKPFDNNSAYIPALENLIKRYKELEEKADRLGKLYYEANENCIKYEKNYIPKSKVKEKIEEIEKQMQKDEVDDFGIHSIGWSALDYIVDYLKSL